MNIQLSYNELETFIQKKYHQQIALTFGDEHTVNMSKSFNMFIRQKTVNIAISILKVEDNDIVLTYHAGLGLDLMLQGALAWFKDSVGDLLEHPEGTNRLIIHLAKVKQLEKVLSVVMIQDIKFDEGGVHAMVGMK
ncbi:MAG: hypothetical protein IKG96_09945 [Bacteroidaceae bacterium]|nr:hypothetical protein [Bacteroidaceae bacterium]